MKFVDRFKPRFAQLNKLLQNRWLRLATQLLILALCTVYLVNNLQSIKSTHVEFKFNLLLIVISGGITIVAVFLGAFGYYFTLKAFLIPLIWLEAVDIHLQSNLAKYIPGYAWQLVGKAYLTGMTGVSAGMIGLAMTVELIQLLLAGVCMAFLSLPLSIVVNLSIGESIIRLLPFIRIFTFALFLLFPFILSWILKRSTRFNHPLDLKPLILLLASLCIFLGWLLFGYSFWLLGKSLITVTTDQLFIFVFTLAASFLIGLAIIIVPGSIGVRESVMVWLLGPVVGAPQAVIIAALARFTVTLSELFSAFVFRLIKRGWNNPKVLDTDSNTDGRD